MNNDHLTKLKAQRDEYRQHMERYRDEVAELKAENLAFVSALRKMALDAALLKSELDFTKALLEQSEDHPSIDEDVESELKAILDNSKLTIRYHDGKFKFSEFSVASYGHIPIVTDVVTGSTLTELIENYKARDNGNR